MKIYAELVVWLWLSAGHVFVLWINRGYEYQQLGFRFPDSLRFWIVSAAVIAILVFFVFMYFGLRSNEKLRSRVRASLTNMDEAALVPTTPRELCGWGVCSASAASEEIVFRGFAIWYLTDFVALPIAAVVSTFVFALAHAYQGISGIIRSGIYGAVLLTVFLVSGSIWPAIILHVAQDFYSGMAGYLSSERTMPNTSQ